MSTKGTSHPTLFGIDPDFFFNLAFLFSFLKKRENDSPPVPLWKIVMMATAFFHWASASIYPKGIIGSQSFNSNIALP